MTRSIHVECDGCSRVFIRHMMNGEKVSRYGCPFCGAMIKKYKDLDAAPAMDSDKPKAREPFAKASRR